MSGELTAQGLIDARGSTAVGVPTATMTLPGNNVRRYSLEGSPLQSSLGIFRDRLTDIGDIDYSLQSPRDGLKAVTVNLRLADLDGDIRSIVNRYGASSLRGSPVIVDLATPSPVADWPRWFTGIIDGIEPAARLEWSVAARVDDRPMVDGTFRIPRISSFDYPNALEPHLERLMPVALGLFDSRDGTVAGSTGSVQLVRLNESDGVGFPYKYLLGASWASSVRRVAVNGTTLASTSWIRTYTSRNGIDSTEVWLATDPGATAKVTADLQGIGEDVSGSSVYLAAAGTGAPITNLVKQIRWLLRSYVWSAYRSGAHPGDPAALASATWDAAEAWADRRRFRGTILVDDVAAKPIDLFNAFMEWAWVRAGWTRAGKLALYPFDDEDTPYYSDTRWIRFPTRGTEDQLRPSIPPNRSAHAIRSASWFIPASNASRSVVSVRDSRVTGSVVVQVDRQLGSARQELQDGYPGPNNLILALNASRPGVQGDAVYLSHNTALPRWRDVDWSPATPATDFPNNYRAAATPFAPVGNEPKWLSGQLNGHAIVRFDGVNDYMQSASLGATGGNWTLWTVVRVNGATRNNATPRDNHGIICSSSGYWGLYVRVQAGVYYLQGSVFLGAGHGWREYPVSLDTWYVVRVRNYSGTLGLSINNWDELTATGFSSNPNSLFNLGMNDASSASPNGYFNGDIAAVLMFDNGDLSSQGNGAGNAFPGLGSNFDIYQALKDRYRL